MGVAEVLSGRLAMVADHLVLALRLPGMTDGASFVLSWYSLAYSAGGTGGNLAFVRAAEVPDGEAILTDAPELDRARRRRLQPRAWPLTDPDRPALAARFTRDPIRDRSLSASIAADGLELDVSWRELALPIVANGRVGADPAYDSSTVLIEAGGWSVVVNGRSVDGAAFPNEVWRPWLDRPLSSALVAVAEVFREVET
jgi:hypothetical protein